MWHLQYFIIFEMCFAHFFVVFCLKYFTYIFVVLAKPAKPGQKKHETSRGMKRHIENDNYNTNKIPGQTWQTKEQTKEQDQVVVVNKSAR